MAAILSRSQCVKTNVVSYRILNKPAHFQNKHFGYNNNIGTGSYLRKRFLLSAAIGADGYCRHAMGSSVRPSVGPSRTTLPVWLFKNFGYRLEIWWADAQYHGADCPLKWQCSAIFVRFMELWFFFMKGTITRSEGWCYRSSSLWSSAISLKFGGVMHRIAKQSAVKMALLD